MATYYADISAALDGHLDTLATAQGVTVLWQNRAGKQPQEAHLRQFLLPVETVQAELGDTGQDYTRVIYQVDVRVPTGSGKADMLRLADLIADHYSRGTVLTYNSQNIRVTGVEIAPSQFDTEFQFMPVSITAETYTAAR